MEMSSRPYVTAHDWFAASMALKAQISQIMQNDMKMNPIKHALSTLLEAINKSIIHGKGEEKKGD